jgi:hypothetical protein
MRWSLLGVSPPAADASRIDQLRLVRDLQVRVAVLLLPVAFLLVTLTLPTWARVASLAAYLSLVIDAVYLTAKIRHVDSGSP